MSVFGWIFAAGVAWALLSGRSRIGARGVSRRDEPLAYWFTVLVMGLIAALLFAWGPVR